MPKNEPLYLGIDLGTGGVRAVAVTGDGQVIVDDSISLPAEAVHQDGDSHEQYANVWWSVTQQVVRNVVGKLRGAGCDPNRIVAVSVDGTSGTIVPLGVAGEPLRPALMYNDGRAANEAVALTALARQAGSDVSIASSYAIARIRWMQIHEPDIFSRTHQFAHQADFIAWHLFKPQTSLLKSPATDYSNALKTGYDLQDERWPDWLTATDALDGIADRLPRVVAPGTMVSAIDAGVAASIDLPSHVKIVTGCSDGTAGFLASGAKNLGDDNTTLGTTLVFKRIANAPVNNELVYSHKLPGGRWLPGAASNTGGEWIRQQFADADLPEFDAQAAVLLPVETLAYPLARTGERFPFRSDDATGFVEPDVDSTDNNQVLRYATMLQGTALFERLCYEQLDRDTGSDPTSRGDIYATGGGAKSDVWLQLRADVTGRTIYVPAYPESAFGAAVLAASGATDQALWESIEHMVRIEKTFTPNATNRTRYDNLYGAFKATLRARFKI